MEDILLKSALSFKKMLNDRYELTVSKRSKAFDIIISAQKEDFTHIIGLDHLKDIRELASHNSKAKGQIYRDILNGKLTFDILSAKTNYLNNKIPLTFNCETNKEYTISERISRTSQIDLLLDNAYSGRLYKWNKYNCNVKTLDGIFRQTKINADYLLVIPSPYHEKEKIYIFTYILCQEKNQPIKLSIKSAFADCIDLTRGQDRPYIILQETKVNTKTKEKQILFTHPKYARELSEENREESVI